MAQLVVAAAGAAIGGMIAPGIVAFGMTGASIGWMAGSMLGSAFAPTQKGAGPQLSDLSVSTSAYGTPIPYVAGHPRIAGQIVWASNKREIATTTEQGKGGGGSEYTSYTYEVDLLILLTDNEIAGVSRVWSNGDLVYDGKVKDGLWGRMTQYTGGPAQLPDPTYEASVGTVNAPAYRGRGSVFIQSLQLGGSGQIPNLTFEIGNSSYTYSGFLLRFDNPANPNTYPDETGKTWSVLGGAPLSTVEVSGGQSRFGGGSLKISMPTGSSNKIGTSFEAVAPVNNKFTIQCWFYTNAGYVDSQTYLANLTNTAGEDCYLIHNALRGGLIFRYRIFTAITAVVTPNGWNFIEANYDGTTQRLFVNGALVASQVVSAGSQLQFNGGQVGVVTGQAAAYLDYVDDLRVTFGAARNISAYAAPVAPMPNDLGAAIVVTQPTSLAGVVANLCALSGLQPAQYDTSALIAITKPVRSMAISSVSSARTVLDMLAASYHFEAVLSDKIYFRPRASAPAATLTFNELGVVVDGGSTPDPLPLTQANELEIPAQMALTYSNVDGDYQTDTQYSDRLLTGQESTSAMQVPLGFTSSEAKQIVDAMLLDKAVSALTASVSLGVTRAALEPTDVVLLTGEDGSTYRMRIVKKAEASGVTTLECVQDDSTVFEQTGATAGGTASQTTVLPTATTSLELLDVPLLRDADNLPGHYVAVKGSASNWTSAGLFDSLDDLTFSPVTTINSQAIIGTCTTTLPAWAGGNVFDEVSSVTVNVGTQQLVSVTRDDILAAQTTNAALIGGEVVQYRSALLVSAGVYTLSGFLRGMRGTVSTGHIAAERFVNLSAGGLRFIPLQAGDLGRVKYYKAASAGQALSAVTSQAMTPVAVNLKPFAPVNARANRNAADTVITWTRQTRLSTRIVGTLGINSPLGEATESYAIEVYTAGHAALLRTLTSATPAVTYTSAQQVTDFGSAPATLAIKVYQISATVGRGTPLTVII